MGTVVTATETDARFIMLWASKTIGGEAGASSNEGEVADGPRKEFVYFTDNGDLTAVRYAD